jgi:hypothetical protein
MRSYTRTPRAAVAAPLLDDDHEPPVRRQSSAARRPAQTLWASRPLTVHAGRLVAVRLRGDELHVAVATLNGLRWVHPATVLTTAQAEAWVAKSEFAANA